MPISSLIVHVDEGDTARITRQINLLAGVSVSSAVDNEMVVITETTGHDADRELWDRLESIPGVLNLSLIYHNMEDLAEVNS